LIIAGIRLAFGYRDIGDVGNFCGSSICFHVHTFRALFLRVFQSFCEHVHGCKFWNNLAVSGFTFPQECRI
jgi:hypothetical protein